MTELRSGNPQEAAISIKELDLLLEVCRGWVTAGATPALSILAARHGIIFLHEAWGRLTPGANSTPVDLDSRFGMASCSKPVAATAVMVLVEDGRLALDDPVQDYLPEFEGHETEKITIRHLLTHTSGLPLSTNTDIFHAAENELEFTPGTEMVYSSVGYDLLGKVIESVSGKPFQIFTKERVFEPLGMFDTTFIQMGMDRERCVQARPGTTYDWPKELEGTAHSSSTLWSTSYDMGIFLQTFLNGGRYGNFRLLTPNSVAEMTRNQIPGIPREYIDGIKNPPPGLGWFMLDGIQFPNSPKLTSPDSYGHSGASGAFIWVDPTYDLIGAFLFTKIRETFRPLDVFVDSIVKCIIDN